MNYLRRKPVAAVVVIAAFLAGAALPLWAQTRKDQPPPTRVDLFRAVGPAFDLSPEQTRTLAALRQDPSSGPIQILQINLSVPKTADAVNFNLSPDSAMMLETRGREDRAPDDYSWIGGDSAGGKSAVLVVKGQKVTGTIRDGGKVFRVRPLGEGVHAVIEVDQKKLPPDHPPSYQKREEQSKKPPTQGQRRGDVPPGGVLPASLDGATPANAGSSAADACARIDVLVAHTPRAGQQAGDIDGLIQLAMDETNLSYSKSGITPRLRLVHSYATNYTESGDMETDVQRFASPGDGFLDEVQAKRDAHGADLAVLITGNGNFCGIAHDIMASADGAYAVVGQNCATGYYSFGHELGHLQGARHNPEADSTSLPFPYGHGYFSTAIRKRTVMAYDCPVGCTRIDVWASPAVIVEGTAMGTASLNHDARVINETACTVAGFRQVSAPSPPAPPPPAPPSHVTPPVTPPVTPAPPPHPVPGLSAWSLVLMLALAPFALRRGLAR